MFCGQSPTALRLIFFIFWPYKRENLGSQSLAKSLLSHPSTLLQFYALKIYKRGESWLSETNLPGEKNMKTGITDHRPWGSFTILEEQATYKVKRIEVLPGQRLSYQSHEKRSEHWMIVGGQARVTLNGKDMDLSSGQAIDVPRGAAHRIANSGTGLLTFIEIQQGDYFGEDDIVRLEDDYGRTDNDE